jgi:hypothetical protein
MSRTTHGRRPGDVGSWAEFARLVDPLARVASVGPDRKIPVAADGACTRTSIGIDPGGTDLRLGTRPRSLAALSLAAAVVACVPGALAGTRKAHVHVQVSKESHASTKPARTSRRWAAATAFSRPAFTPARRIQVSSASAFWSAWNAIRPGDEIDVHGVTFSGEQSFNTRLSGWAEVHFDSGTTFTGTPGQNLPDVWIDGASHVRFYGGDLTNPQGGAGVMIYDASYVTWWGFDIHGTGGTGLFVTGVHRANDHLDLKGTISRWGLNLGFDPHQEKGTGLHGANLADAYYGVEDSRFALHLENGSVGAGVEAGGKTDGDFFRNNRLYLWCQNLTMRATSQIGGNCLQVWGEHVNGNTVAYLEAENLQGRPYDANGMYAGQSLTSDTVHIGPASRTNLNPALAQTEAGVGRSVRWDPRHGTRFVP